MPTVALQSPYKALSQHSDISAESIAPYQYDIKILWDEDARVWVAIAEDIPLVLESASFDTLVERVRLAAPEILELNTKPFTPLHLRFLAERIIADG